MSFDIKPGDLVMVVRPTVCCGDPSRIGFVTRVESLRPKNQITLLHCKQCHALTNDIGAHLIITQGWIARSRLKKLEPPALADETETQRELEEV